jgi:hypothetical protein
MQKGEEKKNDELPEYRDDCPCKKQKCERHNKCRECHAHHAQRGSLPVCLR